jgi:ligand-binding sensor domain-containing protein/signal transduction histidine kinase
MLSMPNRVLALDPTRDISEYNCQNWSRQNGLPANWITAIAQSKDGYLWLGTAAGLVRFDGTEFKTIELVNAPRAGLTEVTSLTAAKAGGLWVGLKGSSFGYCDGETLSFRGKKEWGGLDLGVNALFESDDESLWIVASQHLARLTPAGEFEEMLTNTNGFYLNLLSGYQDAQGRIWYGLAPGAVPEVSGVYYLQAGRSVKIPDPALNTSLVFATAVDTDGQIWVGTSRGLFCYDAGLRRKAMPLIREEVRALLVDRESTVWIGTAGRGLARYRNGQLEFLGRDKGLASEFVNAIAEDREGSLWIGTRSGLTQLMDVRFPIKRTSDDPGSTDVLAVTTARQGGIWAVGQAGLIHMDKTKRTYWTESGLPESMIKRVFEARNGEVYVINENNDLLVFAGGKVVAKYSPPKMAVGLAEDARGVMVSVAGELYRVGTNYFTPCVFTNGVPELWWVLNLAPGRDGEIWVACAAGIFRVNDCGWQRCASYEQLGNVAVQGVCQDTDGVVWAWTAAGICRVKDNQVKLIDREHGLFDNDIRAIVPDDYGNLWVDTSCGVFRVTRKGMNDFAEGKASHVECISYGGPHDVKSVEKKDQERVGCKSSDGRIWFPNPGGVVVIDPVRVPSNPHAPPVHITSVRANGVDFGRRADLIVPPGNGELEIHFAALSFVAPHELGFRYRLEGYNRTWVEVRDRRTVFYTGLRPGSYRFSVQACNEDMVWNIDGDSLALELKPHYYETRSFRVLTGLAGGLGLFGLYLWRLRGLRHKQASLQQAHDWLESEVAKRTTELRNEIEERKRMQSEVERVHRELLEASRLAGMAEVATGVLHNVGNVLNSVNVSTALLADRTRKSRITVVGKAAALLKEHEADLSHFLTRDPKGQQLPSLLAGLAEQLTREQAVALEELGSLQKHVDHIKEIVAMQQAHAKVMGVTTIENLVELLEDALRRNEATLAEHRVALMREFETAMPPIAVDRHKVMQILLNLMSNAKHACIESVHDYKQVTVRLCSEGKRIRISVTDNGVGIAPENMVRIFNHGFTTRKNGHGFGLHSSALAAKEMGGDLCVESAGPGQGATFVLELPITAGRIENGSVTAHDRGGNGPPLNK